MNFVNAQQAKLKDANDNFNNHAYALAIESYEELVAKGYETEEVYKNLGDANYNNGTYVEAAKWYKKLLDLKSDATGYEYLFRYAQSLKSIGDYKSSDSYMRKFQKAKKEDLRALKFSENEDYLEVIKAKNLKFEIKKLNINSVNSDFAPSMYDKSLVFASARDSGTFINSVHEWNNKPFLNLYKVAIQEDSLGQENGFGDAEKFSKELNSKTHESSTIFTKDGKTVYFTRNNTKNGNFQEDETGLSRLKIYRATLVDGVWTNEEELPFNNDSYSTAHPSLNADETKLFFASDMQPSKGASDIFVVTINEDGTFGTPENLGDTINTEARETFPFMASDGILYFASDGHPGLGGLDMYSIAIDENGEVENLGEPINSKFDDFSLLLNNGKQTGFFASNREGGMGDDDIYGFTFEKLAPEPEETASQIKGTVIDKDLGTSIPLAKVTIYDYANNALTETIADANGKFATEIAFPFKKYRFVAEVENYNDATVYLITPGGEVDNTIDDLNFIISMERGDESAVIGSDLVQILNLKPIYFNLNSSYLSKESYPELDKVVAYMKANPEATVEVGSHSDSRESDRYNLWLSDRRAKSTVKYIVSMGISESRITGKGYGETQLVNKCSNNVKCSDDEHSLNRRSEFIMRKN